MKNLNRNGEVLEDSGDAFEEAMEHISNRIIWPSLIAAALLGLFCATGLVILIVKFCNWVMT
jgi:maltodextrin utilization protein YvdJ